jgi:DoxX-like family
MNSTQNNLLRYSLVFVWLATAMVSIWERNGQSAQLLSSVGIDHPLAAGWIIWGGALIDAGLGLAIWMKPARATYRIALAVMAAMTLVATILEPTWWLHPLGPLTKNIPIAAVLWVLAKARP